MVLPSEPIGRQRNSPIQLSSLDGLWTPPPTTTKKKQPNLALERTAYFLTVLTLAKNFHMLTLLWEWAMAIYKPLCLCISPGGMHAEVLCALPGAATIRLDTSVRLSSIWNVRTLCLVYIASYFCAPGTVQQTEGRVHISGPWNCLLWRSRVHVAYFNQH